MINRCGFETEAFGCVDSFGIIVRFHGGGWCVGGFVDGKVVELGGVAAVEEEGSGSGEFLDYDVPGVDGAGACH